MPSNFNRKNNSSLKGATRRINVVADEKGSQVNIFSSPSRDGERNRVATYPCTFLTIKALFLFFAEGLRFSVLYNFRFLVEVVDGDFSLAEDVPDGLHGLLRHPWSVGVGKVHAVKSVAFPGRGKKGRHYCYILSGVSVITKNKLQQPGPTGEKKTNQHDVSSLNLGLHHGVIQNLKNQ